MIKYTKEQLEEAVKKSVSFAGVLRALNIRQSGGYQAHIKRRIVFYNIDFSHFTGQAHGKGKPSNNKKGWKEILVKSSKVRREDAFRLRRALIESGVDYSCKECKIDGTYNGKAITLQVDHIDGDWTNHVKENLRFLCPNCHSQTNNFGSKNKSIVLNNYCKMIKEKKKRSKKKYYCSKCNKQICNRANNCKNCYTEKRRIVVRPNKEHLEQLVYMLPFVEIAKLYEVTDNAIRKWCKFYKIEIPKLPTGFWLRNMGN